MPEAGQAQPVSRKALSVTMFGPDTLGLYATCTFSSMASGGVPPYSYEWKRDGVTVSTSVTYGMPGVTTSGFALAVYVTDAVNNFTYEPRYACSTIPTI